MGGKRVIRNYDSEGNLVSKECSKCHKIKSVSEFYKDIDKSDELQPRCKECSKIYNKKHYQENPNYFKERDKKRRQENPDYFKKYYKKYYQENFDYIKENKRKYYQENKESKKEYDKKYYQENPDYFKKHNKEYYEKNTQEALQQIKIEVESNPEKYNYREGEKIYGVIYLVNNIKSNKYYVGQTTRTFDIRYKSGWLHEHGCKNSVKEDLGLYGENSFKYIKLFKVAHSQHELDKLEAYYIDYYDSYENGYNETRGNVFTDRGKEK